MQKNSSILFNFVDLICANVCKDKQSGEGCKEKLVL